MEVRRFKKTINSCPSTRPAVFIGDWEIAVKLGKGQQRRAMPLAKVEFFDR